MKNYEQEYYLLKRVPFREKFLSLRATLDTGRRNHTYERLDYGDGPVFLKMVTKAKYLFTLLMFKWIVYTQWCRKTLLE